MSAAMQGCRNSVSSMRSAEQDAQWNVHRTSVHCKCCPTTTIMEKATVALIINVYWRKQNLRIAEPKYEERWHPRENCLLWTLLLKSARS